MTGNWHMQELFSTCVDSNSFPPRGCAPTCRESIKLKHTRFARAYANRCITSNGGRDNLPRTAPCEADARDANGRQSQWWELIPDAAGGDRIRLADSFLCLEAKKASFTGDAAVMALGNCDANNTAQLFEHVEACYTWDGRAAGCIRTGERNSFNIDGSAEKRLYAHGWSSNADKAVGESYVPLDKRHPSEQPYGHWEFGFA